MTGRWHDALAFGLRWRSDLPLPGYDPLSADAPAAVPIVVRRADVLPDRPGRSVTNGRVFDDGVRLHWRDEVVFEMTGGERIDYVPRIGWRGEMPASFYATMAALTMAWRGMVPFHACAVELDGRAVLIAGPAGAGKSTLTAGLLLEGAGFVGDDLSAATIDDAGRIAIPWGRPTIRLHADTAATLDAADARPVAGDPRGKWIVRPRRRSALQPLDLAAVIILQHRHRRTDERAAAGLGLLDHLFRRHWLKHLPMRTTLMGKALRIATTVPVIEYPALPVFDASIQRRRARDVIALVAGIGGPNR